MQFFAYHDVGGKLAKEKGDLRVMSPLGEGSIPTPVSRKIVCRKKKLK
jgi:hypothetical protein